MLKIRLQRVGRKNQPTFRVVLSDSRRSAKTGSVLEVLGWRNPTKHEHVFEKERILYWLSKGAQASGTIHNFLVEEDIVKGAKVDVASRPKKTEVKEGEGAKESSPKADSVSPKAEVPATKNEEQTVEAVKEDKKEEEAQEAKS